VLHSSVFCYPVLLRLGSLLCNCIIRLLGTSRFHIRVIVWDATREVLDWFWVDRYVVDVISDFWFYFYLRGSACESFYLHRIWSVVYTYDSISTLGYFKSVLVVSLKRNSFSYFGSGVDCDYFGDWENCYVESYLKYKRPRN